MEGPIVYEKQLSFSKLFMHIVKVGEDYNITILGGEKPHIGCTVLSIPRLSLTGNNTISATSSVLNVTGHKDEEICRYVAEKVCTKKNAIVVCSGGFHVDNISKEKIHEVIKAVEELSHKFLA